MNADRCVLPVDEVLSFDVVVVGGGMAAICAAIAAARNGCETALLEMDPVLGGNGGPLLGVHVSGAHSFHPYASETGIIEEIELEAARQRAKTRTWGSHYNISHQWDLILQGFLEQAGVRLFRHHQGRRALTEERRIVGVLALDTEHFRTRLFRVRHGVIDGSGDGIVARDAGASFMWGTEARETFGERSAPDLSSEDTMGTSLTALVRKCAKPVAFVMPPEFAARARSEGPPVTLKGYPSSWNPEDEFCFLWVTESGGNRNPISAAADIRREILYQLYRTWDNVKNHSFVELARNWELSWVSPKSGKRESHRFVGDYVLTQTDVEAARPFPDSIGYGGYGVDIHEPVGRGTRIVFHSIPPLWNFPYRSGYSRDFDNLWLVGRLQSVSHLALGTVRLMRTLACIGQGVGTAVALAKQLGCTAAEVGRDHLEALQQTLLAQDATILTASNRDPNDLARRARVSASSEMRHGAQRVAGFLPLDIPRGVQLWDWAERFETVEFFVRNPGSEPHLLTLSLELYEAAQPWKEERPAGSFPHLRGRSAANRMEWGCDNTVSAFAEIARTAAVVVPGFEGWVTFAFEPVGAAIPKDPTADESRYNLVLDPCPGIEIGVDAHGYDFALRLWQSAGQGSYSVDGDCQAFRLSPAPVYGEAVNVINGHHRRTATNPVNAWLSDFDLPLPQDLTLTWDQPQELGRVQLTFDTLDRAYRDAPINCDEPYARRCVTSYQLEALTADGWRLLAEEEDNCQRHRIHRFEPVTASAIRLTVRAVRDSAAFRARVYEIRAYPPE
jgi:hypothetical protein